MMLLALALTLHAGKCDAAALRGLQSRYVAATKARDVDSLGRVWREALPCGMPGTPGYSRFEMLAADTFEQLAANNSEPERNRAFERHLLLNIANDKDAEEDVRREARRKLRPFPRTHYD